MRVKVTVEIESPRGVLAIAEKMRHIAVRSGASISAVEVVGRVAPTQHFPPANLPAVEYPAIELE